MHTIVINQDLCSGCGLCVRQCFRYCIHINAGKKAEAISNENSPCVGCGHCTAVCPNAAISLDGIEPRKLLPADFTSDERQIEQFIKTRRSIRLFQKKKVEREKLKKALEIASYAPTGANNRNVGYVIIDSEDKISLLRETVATWMSHYPRWYAHYKKFRETGEDTILRGAQAVIAIHNITMNSTDPASTSRLSPQAAAGAASYLELALHGLGLGSCWSGIIIRGAEQSENIRDIFCLSKERSIYAALLIGYPAFHFQRIPQRTIESILWI